MRCRRVRSYLSAYCRGELTGQRRQAVREHIDACPECRQEEAVFWEIKKSMSNRPEYKVSDDFNSKLLDRIAKERFRETRTKAYLPKRAPIFGQGKLIPAFASVCLVLVFVMFGGVNFVNSPDEPVMYVGEETTGTELPDDYIIALPEEDKVPPVIVEHAKAGWVFKQKLAKANRMRNLMNRLASRNSFGSGYSHSPDDQLVPASQSMIMRRPTGMQTNGRTHLISGN